MIGAGEGKEIDLNGCGKRNSVVMQVADAHVTNYAVRLTAMQCGMKIFLFCLRRTKRKSVKECTWIYVCRCLVLDTFP